MEEAPLCPLPEHPQDEGRCPVLERALDLTTDLAWTASSESRLAWANRHEDRQSVPGILGGGISGYLVGSFFASDSLSVKSIEYPVS